MLEPLTFSGSNSSLALADWINQVTLYCLVQGTVTDHQKIVYALGRLCAPAAMYMHKFYDDAINGKDLDLFKDVRFEYILFGAFRDSHHNLDSLSLVISRYVRHVSYDSYICQFPSFPWHMFVSLGVLLGFIQSWSAGMVNLHMHAVRLRTCRSS